MNPRRWIYLCVLGLSLLALLADRLWLGDPASADAASIALPAVPTHRPAVVPQNAPQPGSADSIVQRLRALPSPAVIRDVFALSGDFPAQAQTTVQSETETEQQRYALAITFPTHHKLQTTLLGGEEMLAVVDGQVLHLGQVVDGLSLCRVEPGRAVFCDPSNTPAAVLTLDPPQN